MAETRWNAASFHPWITIKQGADRCDRIDRRLLSRNVVDHSILRIRRRRLYVPSQTKVQCDARFDPEIILHEERRVPRVRIARDGCVLRDRTGNAYQQIGKA